MVSHFVHCICIWRCQRTPTHLDASPAKTRCPGSWLLQVTRLPDASFYSFNSWEWLVMSHSWWEGGQRCIELNIILARYIQLFCFRWKQYSKKIQSFPLKEGIQCMRYVKVLWKGASVWVLCMVLLVHRSSFCSQEISERSYPPQTLGCL